MISYENYRTNKRTGQVPLFQVRLYPSNPSNQSSIHMTARNSWVIYELRH
jgi:hypothetical protein